MKTSSYYIKSLILSVVIFLESFFLAQLILTFVRQQSIFFVDFQYSATVIFSMLALLYTISLTVGGWGKWSQYIILTIPTAMALFITTFDYSPIYAPVITLAAVLMIIIDVEKSTRLRDLMIKFDPAIVLRFSTRGLLFVFSILGGVLFFMHSMEAKALNLGKQVAEFAEEPVKRVIENQIKEQAMSGLGTFGINDQVTNNLEELGIDNPYNLSITDSPLEGLNLKDTIEGQVNNLLKPYESFIAPLMAILTFTIFQFYSSIAFALYLLTIRPIFYLANRMGFFKKETVNVEKEILRF